jgi:hypothetical protein
LISIFSEVADGSIHRVATGGQDASARFGGIRLLGDDNPLFIPQRLLVRHHASLSFHCSNEYGGRDSG